MLFGMTTPPLDLTSFNLLVHFLISEWPSAVQIRLNPRAGEIGSVNLSGVNGPIPPRPGLPARVPLDRFPYPKHPSSTVLGPGVPDGTYVFVQDVRGTVHIAQNGPHMHPRVLGNATAVASAGEITIQNGIIVEINNLSGTFRSSSSTLNGVQSAVESQGLQVAPNAVKPFEWPTN